MSERGRYVHVDCEVALYTTVPKVFPDIQVRLCYFHITKAIKDKKGKLGLIAAMKKNIGLCTWPSMHSLQTPLRNHLKFTVHVEGSWWDVVQI